MKPKQPNPGESVAELNPELAKEWSPTKNGGLKPEDVRAYSHRKVWWECPMGDDHVWQATVADRSNGCGCSICSGRKTVNSNCLATVKPDLAKEWHSARNGDLTPYDVSVYSNKKVWWQCSAGKDHEWISTVYNRSFGRGCPVCSNKKVVNSNCLATVNPELTKEWHIAKNGNLTPYDVSPGSNKKVWWKCSKGDDHAWQATIASRSNGNGCAICSNRKVVISNCLATANPELTKEWHPTKNGDLTPFDVPAGSHRMVWWKCPKGEDHEWKAIIKDRNEGGGCSVCANRTVVLSNCLATLNSELANEWHPTKNGDLTPYDVTPQSNKKIWWKCPKGDDHEWKTTISKRDLGHSCPVCSNQKVVKSNCLATLNPELAKEWHPTKNGKLTPYDVAPGSNKSAWWKCPVADDHEWKAVISQRNDGIGCGVCANRVVVKSNCLATLDPELAKEWHPTKNGKLNPFDVTPGTHKKVWWKCPRGDDHEWKTAVKKRSDGTGCPVCSNASSAPELRIYCELKTIFPTIQHRAILIGHEVDIYIPELQVGIEYDGEYWHRDKVQKDFQKNIALKSTILLIRIREKGLPKISDIDIELEPKNISADLIKKILQSVLKHRQINSSVVIEKIYDYLKRSDWIASSYFDKLHTERHNISFEKSISYLFPELSKEWHPTKNDPLLPEHFTPGSVKKVWWQNYLGHEWQSPISNRVRTERNRIVPGQLDLFEVQE
jgi:hypothetical protein